MKKRTLFLSVLTAALAVGVTAAGFGLRGTISAAQSNPRQASVAGVRRVFTESESRLMLADSLETAQRNTQAVNAIVSRRAGLRFSDDALALLNQAEARYAAGGKATVTAAALSVLLTEIAIERVATMSDAEIEATLNTMRGLRTEQTPNGTLPEGQILLRPWGPTASLEKARAYLRKAKSPSERAFVADFARLAITNEVENRIKLFEAAQPEVWSARRITPTQAALLTYSVLSGDQLILNSDELDRQMRGLQRRYAEKQNLAVTIEGRPAYGVNGVLYGSPLNLFDDRTLKALVSRLG